MYPCQSLVLSIGRFPRAISDFFELKAFFLFHCLPQEAKTLTLYGFQGVLISDMIESFAPDKTFSFGNKISQNVCSA